MFNQFFMKKIIINLLFISCSVFAAAQDVYPDSININWQADFVAAFSKNQGLQYELTRTYIFRDVDTSLMVEPKWEVQYKFNITPQAIEVYVRNVAAIITNDSMKVIDHAHKALSYGAIKPDSTNPIFDEKWNPFGSRLWPRYSAELNKYAPFYLKTNAIHKFKAVFLEMYDTTISGKKIKAYKTVKHISNERINGGDWYPVYDTIIYFCNTKSNLIEHIHVYSNNAIKYFDFNNLSLKADETGAEESFDINNAKYKNYQKYNFNLVFVHPRLASIGWPDEEFPQEKYMSDEVRNIPLIDAFGKKKYLKDFSGWILVDLWIYGCKPCMDFHDNLKKEQEKYGFRLIEKEGVTILCINPSKDPQKLSKYASRFNITDIAYWTNDSDFFDYFNVLRYPRYYLYAPDGTLVFEGIVDANNYSALLQAKKEYEQKNPARNEK